MKALQLLATLALMSATTIQAQILVHPRFEVGASKSQTSSQGLSHNFKTGFRIGTAIEIGLGSGLYLAPGLTYRVARYKDTSAQTHSTNGNSLTLLEEDKYTAINTGYLSVPVDIGYRRRLLGIASISLETGPYFSWRVADKTKVESVVKSLDISKTINSTFHNGDYKGFDMGFNASAALQVLHLYLRIGAEYGLTNTHHDPNLKTKNISYYATLGLRL